MIRGVFSWESSVGSEIGEKLSRSTLDVREEIMSSVESGWETRGGVSGMGGSGWVSGDRGGSL